AHRAARARPGGGPGSPPPRRLRAGHCPCSGLVKLTDACNARRNFTVVDVTDRGCWAEATQTTYVVPGTVLRHERGVARGDDRRAPVGELPRGENAIPLRRGTCSSSAATSSPAAPPPPTAAGAF